MELSVPPTVIASERAGERCDCSRWPGARELGHANLGDGRGGLVPAGDECERRRQFGSGGGCVAGSDCFGAKRAEKTGNREAENQASVAEYDRLRIRCRLPDRAAGKPVSYT